MTTNSEGTDDDVLLNYIPDFERSDDDVIPDHFLPFMFNDEHWQGIVDILGADVSLDVRFRLETIADLYRRRDERDWWRRNHPVQIAALASTLKGARAFLDVLSTPGDIKAFFGAVFSDGGEFTRRFERVCKIAEWLAEPPTETQYRADLGARNEAWWQLAALFEQLTGKHARVSVPPNGPFWHFMRAFYAAALPGEDMPTGAQVREWIRKYWIPQANGEPNDN